MSDGPTDNIFTSQQLLSALKDAFMDQSDGGRLFEETIEYALNTTFRGVGEMEVLDTTRIDVFDAARYNQKTFAGTVVFSDLEKLRNTPAGRKIDLVTRKVKNGVNSAMEQLNAVLYGDGSGNGGNDPDGLAKVISSTPTVGTVGGINAGTFPFWRNRQMSGTNTGQPFNNLRASATSLYNLCSLGGTDRVPTAIISDRASLEGYESLLVNVERIVREGKAGPGDIGFDNNAIRFKACGWSYDEVCPAGTAYFLNDQFLKLYYLKGGWMKMKDPVEPANQLSAVHRVFSVINLGASARRHLGVLTGIN